MYTLVMDCPSAAYIHVRDSLRHSVQQQQQQQQRRQLQPHRRRRAARLAVFAESANYFARSLVARNVVGLSDGILIPFRSVAANERANAARNESRCVCVSTRASPPPALSFFQKRSIECTKTDPDHGFLDSSLFFFPPFSQRSHIVESRNTLQKFENDAAGSFTLAHVHVFDTRGVLDSVNLRENRSIVSTDPLSLFLCINQSGNVNGSSYFSCLTVLTI